MIAAVGFRNHVREPVEILINPVIHCTEWRVSLSPYTNYGNISSSEYKRSQNGMPKTDHS